MVILLIAVLFPTTVTIETAISDYGVFQVLLTGLGVMISTITTVNLRRIQDQAVSLQAANQALTQQNRELDLAKREADEANRLKSEFLSTMSHELRTPLNAILGFSEIMKLGMGVKLEPVSYGMIERVHSNAEHLLELINDILDLSKIESGRFEIETAPFDVRALVKAIESQVSGLLAEKVEFQVDVHGDLPRYMMGDMKAIHRVITNLLSNAFKFTSQGHVALTLRPVKDEMKWQIQVQDTGIGIPPDALTYIFEAFRQADGSTTRKYQGTGLGLAITQTLVREMGGTINVKSELGRGSTFTIVLPMDIRQAEKEPSS
ncbi:MAG: hypothetical protein GYB68_09420 [Chloroflexi bacterium]|nr:hypothetical protein [Chloroflexota bacterium]